MTGMPNPQARAMRQTRTEPEHQPWARLATAAWADSNSAASIRLANSSVNSYALRDS